MKREIFELWILSQVFILTRLALFEIEFSVVLAKFQTNSLEWKRENSKLQPPESTQEGQNSASYWIPWLSLSHGVSLQLVAPWMGKSAAHSHVLPGPPSREYAVLLLRQSCGNATLMSPCTRSTDPAVAARSFLLDHSFTRSRLSCTVLLPWMKQSCLPPWLSLPLFCIYFFKVSLSLDCFSNLGLSQSHKIVAPARGKECLRIVARE